MPFSILKTNNTFTSREYILDLSLNDSRDNVLKFNVADDGVVPGLYQIKLNAIFSGGATNPIDLGAPPIVLIEADIAMYGLYKIYKFNFTPRPLDRPPLGSIPAATPEGYITSTDSIESLILPSDDPDANKYESMFFYTYDTTNFGYYIDTDLIVNIDIAKPVYIRWGSAIENKQSSLLYGSLQLITLQQQGV